MSLVVLWVGCVVGVAGAEMSCPTVGLAHSPLCPQFSSFDIHINPTGTTIRDLLRLFCNTLEEQISHRRYFYKSSVMVHEGMVNVQK